MRKMILSLIICLFYTIGELSAQQITAFKSNTSVEIVTDRIIRIIKLNELDFLNIVSVDSVAKGKGVLIPPTKIISFEESDLSMGLISCSQTTSLDLPMKILVWEENEDVYIGFFDPQLLRKRFILNGCDEIINSMSKLKFRIVNQVLKEDL